jgi:PIN domain nuclease of toxin-antitoxin system
VERVRSVIVLDTAAWLWHVSDPTRLSTRARRAIAGEEPVTGLVVSAISVWEVAVKVSLKKLTLDRDVRSWFALARAYPGVALLALDPDDALESALLPEPFHRDPADRIIVALTRRLGARLVTSDRAIRSYPHVKTIW